MSAENIDTTVSVTAGLDSSLIKNDLDETNSDLTSMTALFKDNLHLNRTTKKFRSDKVEASSIHLLDAEAAIADFLEIIHDITSDPPSLYIDIEGINLSRHGSISILQIYVLPEDKTYLIDIHVLEKRAFSTPNSRNTTLKKVLESETIIKVFFDVRNDSDALFAHYGVHLAGIQDLQLMQLATRSYKSPFVAGLGRCIEKDAPMTFSQRKSWTRVKENGKRLFAPELGGSYDVFNVRPLPESIKHYCAQDVYILPKLWASYDNKLTTMTRKAVAMESSNRVTRSHSPIFNGKGRSMAIAPPFFP